MSVPVFVEGNVIDLGSYKLQVVEACSGLRYLFPLMCFGLLCAVMFRASFWQRAAVFLSSIPIAIGMNSFRIAVTGVLVNRFGTEAAEGFLHYFEGWVIFTACLALMFLLMWLFARFSGASLDDVLQPEMPDLAAIRQARSLAVVTPPVLAALALLLVGAASSVFLTGREELIPNRPTLATFPLAIDGRQGTEKDIPTVQLEELKLTDYIIADYRATDGRPPVEMYVAYYESQRKGASIHSPKACLPGGGWEIEDIRPVRVGEGGVRPFEANRVVISLGPQRLLVYYWFMQRGRYLTNEYLVKWYLFWDSLTRRRTDGALVRLTVPVSDAARLDEADAVIRSFIDSAEPRLAYYIPGETAVPAADGAGQVPGAVGRAAGPTLPTMADGR
jgi:exosortase D (VPLPA-CTERM-specific)